MSVQTNLAAVVCSGCEGVFFAVPARDVQSFTKCHVCLALDFLPGANQTLSEDKLVNLLNERFPAVERSYSAMQKIAVLRRHGFDVEMAGKFLSNLHNLGTIIRQQTPAF
jgi:hypothetical protein